MIGHFVRRRHEGCLRVRIQQYDLGSGFRQRATINISSSLLLDMIAVTTDRSNVILIKIGNLNQRIKRRCEGLSEWTHLLNSSFL